MFNNIENMKTKMFLSFLLLGMTLSSCTEEIANNTYTRGKLSIEVMDANIPKTTTRTAYSDLVTTFEGGDKVGLYVVKGSGSGAEVVNDNVCYTYDSSTSRWTTSSDVEYNSDYHYYAYFPYRSDHGYTPAYTATGVDNIFNTFITDSSNKFHETDQSTKENFNKSDLMLAAGTATEAANTITFAMNHKKGLVKFTERGVIETWTGNIPYKPGNDYAYYLMKPSTSTSFTHSGGTFTLSAASGKYVTCNGKTARTVTLTLNKSVIEGYPAYMSYSLSPSGGGTSTVTYSSSNTSILTCDNYGIITGISAGTATITVTVSENNLYQACSAVMNVTVLPNYVDLGLPSGTKWARGNIVSDGNGGYKVGEETNYGAYFSWGNMTPHFSSDGSTFDDGFNWGNINDCPNYEGSPGYLISREGTGTISTGRSYPANTTYDAARACLGGNWQVPTATQFKELYDNTDNEWTTINSVNGRKFMKKSDHSIYVFFPACGYGQNTVCYSRESGCFYWSSSLRNFNFTAYDFDGTEGQINPQNWMNLQIGLPVRAVK